MASLVRDDEGAGPHRRLARSGLLDRNDLLVVDHLVLEPALVGLVPWRRQEDRELLAGLRQLLLEQEQRVPPGVPHRRAAR